MLTGFRSNEARSATLRPGLSWQTNLENPEPMNQFAPWGDNESPDCTSSPYASMPGAKDRPKTSKARLPFFINFIPDIEAYTQNITKTGAHGISSTQEDSEKDDKNNKSRPTDSSRLRKGPQVKNSKGTIRVASPKALYGQMNTTGAQSLQNPNHRIPISFSGAMRGAKLGKSHHKASRSMKHDTYDTSLTGSNIREQHGYLNSLSIERGGEDNSMRFNTQIQNIFCKFDEQTDRNTITYKSKEDITNIDSTEIKSDAETSQLTNRQVTDLSNDRNMIFLSEVKDFSNENTNKYGSLYMKILDESPLMKNMTYKEKKQEMKKSNDGNYRSFEESLESVAWNDLREDEYRKNPREIRKQRSKRDYHPLHMSSATFYLKEMQDLSTSTASRNLKHTSSFAVKTKNIADFDLRTKDVAMSPTVTKCIAHENLKNVIKVAIERPKRVAKPVNDDDKEMQENFINKYIPSMLRCYKDNKKKYLCISSTTSNPIMPTHKIPESSENQIRVMKNIIQKIKSTDNLQSIKRPETTNIASKQLQRFSSYVQKNNGLDEQIMKRYLNGNARPRQNLLECNSQNHRGISGERKASLRQKVANLTELDNSKQRQDFDKSSFTTKNINSSLEKVAFMTPTGKQSRINVRPSLGLWNMGIKNK